MIRDDKILVLYDSLDDSLKILSTSKLLMNNNKFYCKEENSVYSDSLLNLLDITFINISKRNLQKLVMGIKDKRYNRIYVYEESYDIIDILNNDDIDYILYGCLTGNIVSKLNNENYIRNYGILFDIISEEYKKSFGYVEGYIFNVSIKDYKISKEKVEKYEVFSHSYSKTIYKTYDDAKDALEKTIRGKIKLAKDAKESLKKRIEKYDKEVDIYNDFLIEISSEKEEVI